MTFAFTPSCCCEEGTCLIFSDSGTGSDSTTISGTYEASGNWARTSNRIHPDHAASDQRLLGTTAALNTATPGGKLVRATMKGQASDTLGVALFFHSASGDASGAYATGDRAEATITIGSGTAGRFDLKTYNGGVSDATWSEADECSVNEYAIAADTDVTLSLCVKRTTVSGGHSDTLVATLVVGATTYEMGVPLPAALGGSYVYPALTTGTNAITGSFIDWEFYHVSDDCEPCLTCYYSAWPTGDLSANWTQAAGTWSESSGEEASPCSAIDINGVEVSSADAYLIHNDHWANDNLYLNLWMCLDDYDAPFKAGVVFSYVNTTTNWRLEIHGYDEDRGWGSMRFYKLTLWHDDDPVWVTDGPEAAGYANIGVWVYDCSVWVFFDGWAWCATDAADLNDTGKFGVFTGDTVTDYVRFYDLLVQCTDSTWTCVDGYIGTDPPNPDPPGADPDPGDPTGCCDLSALEFGDEIEATVANITYYGAGGCASCTEVDSAWLTALNATHTLRVNWKSVSYTSAFGSTGLDNPCDLVLTSAGYQISITAYIVPIDASTCQMFAVLHVPSGGTCGAAYFASNTFSPGDACTSRELLWQSGNLNGCCLNATTGASITLVPV